MGASFKLVNPYFTGTLTANSFTIIDASNTIYSRSHLPPADKTYTLGGSNAYWKNIYTYNITGVSDVRLKESIQDMSPMTDKIKDVRCREYKLIQNLNDTEDDKTNKQYGLISQELRHVFPEFVHFDKETWNPTSGSDYPLDICGNILINGIYYDRIVTVLVKGLQETMAKVETMETTIQNMTQEITNLKIRKH